MIKLKFTPEAIDQLHHERTHHPHPRVRQRMEAVYLKVLVLSHQEIGRIVRISQTTLREYFQMYQVGRIEALKELNFNQPKSDLDDRQDMLRQEFGQKPPATIAEAVARIEKLAGLRRSPTQVAEFLKKLGLKRRKVASVPAKADPEKQQEFLDDKLTPRLAEVEANKRHLFFVDAAHFALQPFLGIL